MLRRPKPTPVLLSLPLAVVAVLWAAGHWRHSELSRRWLRPDGGTSEFTLASDGGSIGLLLRRRPPPADGIRFYRITTRWHRPGVQFWKATTRGYYDATLIVDCWLLLAAASLPPLIWLAI